jgi:hypothetical protein
MRARATPTACGRPTSNEGRGRRDRFRTASWCRSAMISRCSEARERTVNRSERSSEMTTDDTIAGYRRTLATSMSRISCSCSCRSPCAAMRRV